MLSLLKLVKKPKSNLKTKEDLDVLIQHLTGNNYTKLELIIWLYKNGYHYKKYTIFSEKDIEINTIFSEEEIEIHEDFLEIFDKYYPATKYNIPSVKVKLPVKLSELPVFNILEQNLRDKILNMDDESTFEMSKTPLYKIKGNDNKKCQYKAIPDYTHVNIICDEDIICNEDIKEVQILEVQSNCKHFIYCIPNQENIKKFIKTGVIIPVKTKTEKEEEDKPMVTIDTVIEVFATLNEDGIPENVREIDKMKNIYYQIIPEPTFDVNPFTHTQKVVFVTILHGQ